MAILINENTKFLIQGITGKEGMRVLQWMQKNGAPVLAGVTPGKGGQQVEGVTVYNSVAEALNFHPEINASSIYAPPKSVLEAAREAIEARMPLIHCIAEGVPTADTAAIIELARAAEVRVVGPSSIGIVSPGKSVVGSMGGGNLSQFMSPGSDLAIMPEGGVAVIAKSGGMANTIANLFTESRIPQTTVLGIGGDRLIGTTFADLLPDLASDDETKAVVIIGEIGGTYEENLAEAMMSSKFSKPLVAFISGIFAETLPQGVAFGHAGAIVSKSSGTREGKITALTQAGAIIAATPTDIVAHLLKALNINIGE